MSSFLSILSRNLSLKTQISGHKVMDYSLETDSSSSPYVLLLKVATLIPISHYLAGFLLTFVTFSYNFLEIHFFQDFFSGFKGQSVLLTFNSSSELYQKVASKCQILHGRYLATPWLSSPHFQTVFVSFFGRAPSVRYKRELFITPDGGTIALDWAMNPEGVQANRAAHKDDKDPVVVVVPGLMSDSDTAYVKHLAFKLVKRRWKVVVSNHRGLGGISVTSDCFYNIGWTEDIRKIIDHLHHRYPEAPLFVVGTSLGANILIKYLGEEGANIPISGAAAVCSPYDILIADRFLNRRLLQKFYNKFLTLGLKHFAQLHQPILSRLADWEGMMKSRTVREFDNCGTIIVAKFETADTFYRQCSSAKYVCNVMVPLLCINAMDDPLCTRESIPWDECRRNKNIILATTQHGGHLSFFEGINAKSLWWVRAVDEFLSVLQSSPLMHKKDEVKISPETTPLESSIDQGPFVNIVEDGLVATLVSDPTIIAKDVRYEHVVQSDQDKNKISDVQMDDQATGKTHSADEVVQPMEQDTINKGQDTICPGQNTNNVSDPITPVRKYLNQLSRHSRKSIWLLAYIAIITSWPLVGSGLRFFFKKKIKNVYQLPRKR